MIAYANYRGIGVIGYAPLLDGHLARPLGTDTPRSKSIAGTFFEKPRRESDKKIIQRVEELAKKKQWKMSQVALVWVASKVTAPIVGANSVSTWQLLSVVGCYRGSDFLVFFQPARVSESIITGKTLTAEDIEYLEEL